MSLTNFVERQVADKLFSTVDFSPDVTYFMGVSTTVPTETGSGFTEPVGNGYARVAITNNATEFPSGNPKTNANPIPFPPATGPWGGAPLIAWAFFDAVSGGNMRIFGDLVPSKTIDNGDILIIPAGNLAITVD